MPTSRPGSESAEFWVDGSRRDGTVEEFYTLSSELGRFVPSDQGQNCPGAALSQLQDQNQLSSGVGPGSVQVQVKRPHVVILTEDLS